MKLLPLLFTLCAPLSLFGHFSQVYIEDLTLVDGTSLGRVIASESRDAGVVCITAKGTLLVDYGQLPVLDLNVSPRDFPVYSLQRSGDLHAYMEWLRSFYPPDWSELILSIHQGILATSSAPLGQVLPQPHIDAIVQAAQALQRRNLWAEGIFESKLDDTNLLGLYLFLTNTQPSIARPLYTVPHADTVGWSFDSSPRIASLDWEDIRPQPTASSFLYTSDTVTCSISLTTRRLTLRGTSYSIVSPRRRTAVASTVFQFLTEMHTIQGSFQPHLKR
jgi:hypothetical protein